MAKPKSDICPQGHDKRIVGFDKAGMCKLCHKQRQKKHRATAAKKLSDRDYWLQRKYGITLADYDEKVRQQQGACSICLRTDQQLWVDHNHSTDEVRELLCRECNFAFGLVREDVETMKRMIEYAERHGAGSEREAKAA